MIRVGLVLGGALVGLGGALVGWFVRGWMTDLRARFHARLAREMFGRAGALSQALRDEGPKP